MAARKSSSKPGVLIDVARVVSAGRDRPTGGSVLRFRDAQGRTMAIRLRPRQVKTLAVGVLGLAVALATASGQTSGGSAYDTSVETLAAKIESKPANRDLLRRIAQPLDAARRDPKRVSAAIREQIARLDVIPLRVPGLFYKSHPGTGADLRVIESWLGRPVPLVHTGEAATVEHNAEIVAREIRAHTEAGRRALVISASKGSAEVRTALEADGSLGPLVAIWIDLVGVLEGTALLGDDGPAAEETGQWLSAETARSLSRAVRLAAVATERFPAETRAVHVAAFPRSDEISDAARSAFTHLRPIGPNDGYVLLDSYLRAPGRVLIVRGVDHYLRHEELREQLLALMTLLLDEMEPSP